MHTLSICEKESRKTKSFRTILRNIETFRCDANAYTSRTNIQSLSVYLWNKHKRTHTSFWQKAINAHFRYIKIRILLTHQTREICHLSVVVHFGFFHAAAVVVVISAEFDRFWHGVRQSHHSAAIWLSPFIAHNVHLYFSQILPPILEVARIVRVCTRGAYVQKKNAPHAHIKRKPASLNFLHVRLEYDACEYLCAVAGRSVIWCKL